MRSHLFPALGIALLFALSAPSVARAHPGHEHPAVEVDEFEPESFMSAVAHPFTGLDHLVAALAIGALAFTLGRSAGVSVCVLLIGAQGLGLAAAGMGATREVHDLPLALSVLLAGVLLARGQRTGAVLRAGIIIAIGFWQGSAHAAEVAGAVRGIGLCGGSAAALAAGAWLAGKSQSWWPEAVRHAGAAVALAGLLSAAASVFTD